MKLQSVYPLVTTKELRASRDFRRTQRLVVRAEIYSPAEAAVTVTARLLNRQGDKLVDVPVASRPGQPARTATTFRSLIDVISAHR